MATRKKPSRKRARSKKAAPKKKRLARKKLAKKKAPANKTANKRATTTGKKASAPKKKARRKSERSYPVTFQRGTSGPGSAGQSGDVQGLSRVEDMDSESVNELIEEGNAFEADVVQGVTDAGNADEEEVHTHEVPEDDVPGEYLDKD